jgi:hypothetical protein
MRKQLLFAEPGAYPTPGGRRFLALAVVLVLALAPLTAARAADERTAHKGQVLVHSVYFSLKDHSPAARHRLVQACKKYLSGHPGELYFGAGTRIRDLERPVNDRDFDVALYIVFKDRASHDQYQESKRHLQFIAENKDSWSKVRVFDSLVQGEAQTHP